MNVESLFRFLVLVAYLALCLPVMWALAWLRLLHGPLRLLGVPNQWLPLDVLSYVFIRGMLLFSGVQPVVIGRERVKSFDTIFMGNHSSGLDPFLLAGTAPLNPVFIFKRELMYYFPPLFVMGWIYGHVPISRSRRDSAIKSLSRAARKARATHRSLCVFPEGTRTADGSLLPLKSGPFYLAREAAATISPVFMHGAFQLMNRGQLVPGRPGSVIVEYQPQIQVADYDTPEELKNALAASLAAAQERWAGKPLPAGGHSAAWGVIPLFLLTVVVFYLRSWLA